MVLHPHHHANDNRTICFHQQQPSQCNPQCTRITVYVSAGCAKPCVGGQDGRNIVNSLRLKSPDICQVNTHYVSIVCPRSGLLETETRLQDCGINSQEAGVRSVDIATRAHFNQGGGSFRRLCCGDRMAKRKAHVNGTRAQTDNARRKRARRVGIMHGNSTLSGKRLRRV